MNRCILCGRKMNNTKSYFGLSCLKKMCHSVNIDHVKNLKGQSLLTQKILKLSNKKALPSFQKQLLTDRYLTLNLLNEVPLSCYDTYKNLLQNDINTINRTTTIMNLHSCNLISLKQASEINQKYKEHEDIFKEIMNGKYDTLQNFSFDVVRFAFSNYYNKKPYLSDMTQILQYSILKSAVFVLNTFDYNCSAKCLNNSLHKSPKDLTISDTKTIEKIKNDSNFKNCITMIIKKYGNNNKFDTGEKKESLAFEKGDLFLALHNAYIRVLGTKQNNKWNLEIILSDTYDFTDFKELGEYVNNNDFLLNFLGCSANNLAMIGTACNVVNEYNITIKFNIYNWEE
jgi:hypothetical protein